MPHVPQLVQSVTPRRGESATVHTDAPVRSLGEWALRRRLPPHHLAERWSAWNERLGIAGLVHRIDRRILGSRPVERTLRSIFELSSLRHPHLLAVRDAVSDDEGSAWIVSEFPGTRGGLLTMSSLLAQKTSGVLTPVESLHAAHHLLSALDAAHASGIVHGSLRMEDLLVNPNGAIKVELFGVGAILQPTELPFDRVVREDLRASCGIIHELLTGVPLSRSGVSIVKVPGRGVAGWDRWLKRAFDQSSAYTSAREAIDHLPGFRRIITP